MNRPTAFVRPSRRALLGAGAALAAAPLLRAAPSFAQATPTPGPCLLTPEMTAGPFFIDDMLIRQDITEGRPGAPLRLRLTVTSQPDCQPLAGAAVDIWHCDAAGYYSGVASDPGGGSAPVGPEGRETTFLRGIQVTDEAGVVEFDTIYPGWYGGRAVHIHLLVRVGGLPESGGYEGGEPVHVGQLFFDDLTSDLVYALPPYDARPNGERTRNDRDFILSRIRDAAPLMISLDPVDETDIAQGFTGAADLGVALPAGG
jgi:protocatechuate 3,4-dioxygenase beta subunit